jgi:hypothetical protein
MITSHSSRPLTMAAAALATGLVLAACSSGGSSASPASAGGGATGSGSAAVAPGTAGEVAATASPATGFDAKSGAAAAPAAAAGGPAVVPGLLDRSIIRTAAVSVQVKNVLDAAAGVETLAAGAGGFVSDEQTNASPDHPSYARAVITVRVPGARLPQLLGDLARLGTLQSQSQSSSDVTGQVIDVNARIKSQQDSVNRIRALLAQATTIGQVVQIESELADRQGALESLEGQAKALADQTSLATVTATLVGPAAVPVVPKPTPKPAGFGHGLSQGWKAFTSATTWLLTALGTLLPFVLVAVPLGWAALVYRRRRTGPGAAPVPTEPTPDPA